MPVTLYDNKTNPPHTIAHFDAEIARLQAIIEAGFSEVFARIAALDARLQTLIERSGNA